MDRTKLSLAELAQVVGGTYSTDVNFSGERYKDAGVNAFVVFAGKKYPVDRFKFVHNYEANFTMYDKDGVAREIDFESANKAVEYHAKNGAQIPYEKLMKR